MIKKVEDVIKTVFKTDDFEVLQRLMGGRSNFTYIVRVQDTKYTVRIVGKNGNFFVNREQEKKNLSQVNHLGINNETIYLDLKSGVKVSKYIEGVSLNELEIARFIPDVAKILKTLHQADLFSYDYKPFDRLQSYENLCIDLGFEHGDKYYELKNELIHVKAFLQANKLVACHNDVQASNFIVGDDAVYLTDWEFSNNNDLYYDIACFCESSVENALILLECYLETKPTNEQIKRVLLWRAFQTLQWYNVATYKQLIGLSKDLGVDFEKAALNYLNTCDSLLKMVKDYESK